jgi:hypothetical protein
LGMKVVVVNRVLAGNSASADEDHTYEFSPRTAGLLYITRLKPSCMVSGMLEVVFEGAESKVITLKSALLSTLKSRPSVE